jgi:hypothetical protein
VSVVPQLFFDLIAALDFSIQKILDRIEQRGAIWTRRSKMVKRLWGCDSSKRAAQTFANKCPPGQRLTDFTEYVLIGMASRGSARLSPPSAVRGFEVPPFAEFYRPPWAAPCSENRWQAMRGSALHGDRHQKSGVQRADRARRARGHGLEIDDPAHRPHRRRQIPARRRASCSCAGSRRRWRSPGFPYISCKKSR